MPDVVNESGMVPPAARRVLLKLSGEMFGGGAVGLDPIVVRRVAGEIAEAVRQGVQVAIVVGGGNFFRGAELSASGMERAREGRCHRQPATFGSCHRCIRIALDGMHIRATS